MTTTDVRRQQVVVVTVLTVCLAALIGLVAWLVAGSGSGGSGEGSGGTTASPTQDAGSDGADPADGSASGGADADAEAVAPAVATASGGFSLGAEGVAGTENEGAVVVDVYFDYMCPYCAKFEETNGGTLDELRRAGEVTVVLHPVSILDRFSQGTGFSTRSAAAAALVAQEAPEAFADFNAEMLANQPEENTGGLSDDEIARIASAAGVPTEVAARISDGTALRTYGGWVAQATQTTAMSPVLTNGQPGQFGTPTIAVDGELFGGDWFQPTALRDAIQVAGD